MTWVYIGNPFTSFASGSIAMANAIWGLQLGDDDDYDDDDDDYDDDDDHKLIDLTINFKHIYIIKTV